MAEPLNTPIDVPMGVSDPAHPCSCSVWPDVLASVPLLEVQWSHTGFVPFTFILWEGSLAHMEVREQLAGTGRLLQLCS